MVDGKVNTKQRSYRQLLLCIRGCPNVAFNSKMTLEYLQGSVFFPVSMFLANLRPFIKTLVPGDSNCCSARPQLFLSCKKYVSVSLLVDDTIKLALVLFYN